MPALTVHSIERVPALRLAPALFAVSCALLPAVPVLAAEDPGQLYPYSAGDWVGGAYIDPAGGAFSHCQARREDESGVLVTFAIDRDHELALFLEGSTVLPHSADSFPVTLTVDGTTVGAFKARAQATLLAVQIGSQRAVYEQLSRGHRLGVAGTDIRIEVSLEGSRRALATTKECVDLALALPPDQPGGFADRLNNPYSSGRSPLDNSGQAPSRAERDLVDAWRFLLESAGLPAFDFLRPSDVSPDSPPALAWQTRDGAVLGLLHLFPGGVSAEEVTGLTLFALSESCEGGHFTGGLPAQRAGRYVLKAGSIKCLKNDATVFATVAAIVDERSVTIVIHIAGEHDALLIEAVNAGLIKVVAALLKGAPPR